MTHFFSRVNAAALRIESGGLAQGDRLHFKGPKTDFIQKAVSIQINRVPVSQAAVGDEVGVEVSKEAREGDAVYKLIS